MNTTDCHRHRPSARHGRVTLLWVQFATGISFLLVKVLDGLARGLVEEPSLNLDRGRSRGLITDDRELGNVITDNLGMIVFGILAIVVLGGLISTLGSNVVSWVTKQLGI